MNIESRNRNVSYFGAFLAGASSGACSTFLFQPLDVVKTRLQTKVANASSSRQSYGMLQTFSHVIRTEGARSLWSGLTPSLWRCVPGVAVYFTSLEIMKQLYIQKTGKSLGPLQALILGAASRCVSVGLLMPFTVVKTRFESGHFRYNKMSTALHLIYKQEGGLGLFTGFGATVLRDVPFSALYYAIYSQLKQGMPMEQTAGKSFSCGLISGILASVATHPADVIKTSLQLFPSRYRHRTREAIVCIYRSHGVKGFFSGLMPRLVRRTLVAAMSWTLYDKVMQWFQVSSDALH